MRWEDNSPAGTLVVDELLATTPAAYARLWRYCCEVDLVTEVRAPARPGTEALPWLLTDGRVARLTRRSDGLWVRVLDVARSLTARRYDREGSITVEVVDPLGIAAGSWFLDASPAGADCHPTRATADLVLTVQCPGCRAARRGRPDHAAPGRPGARAGFWGAGHRRRSAPQPGPAVVQHRVLIGHGRAGGQRPGPERGVLLADGLGHLADLRRDPAAEQT